MKIFIPIVLILTLLFFFQLSRKTCDSFTESTPLTVLVTAFETEYDAVLDLVAQTGTCTHSGITYTFATYNDEKLVLFITGVGPAKAREATENTLALFDNIELVVFSGIAGGISENLEVHTVTVASEWLELTTGNTIAIDQALLTQAETIDGVVLVSRGITTNYFVTDVTKLPATADIVDMETYAVAKVLKEYAIPFIAFRTVSDKADGAEKGAAFVQAAKTSANASVQFIDVHQEGN